MKLSIIVVTWNNEGHIEECLRSCIFDTNYEYEVVVVHNASTDSTGSMLRRVTENNPVFRVIENNENVGLGEARNIGLQHANGEFVVFIDGDDWYDESLIKTALPIADEKNSDIVVFNYARYYDTGGIYPPKDGAHLKGGNMCAPSDREILFKIFNSACTKIYKTAFLQQNNMKFQKGLYEDLDWHFKTLCLANSVYSTDKVVLYYRQRHGSILRSYNIDHFDAITRGREVLNFLKQNPHYLSLYGKTIFQYIRSQSLHVLKTRSRLPKNSESKYLKEYGKLVNDFGSTVHISSNKLGQNIALIGSKNLFFTYLKMKEIAIRLGAKKFITHIKSIRKKYTPKYQEILFSCLCKVIPVNKNKIFYESFWGQKAACNPAALYEELQKYDNLKHVWGMQRKQKNTKNTKYVKRGSFKYFWHLASAKVVICNTNLPDSYVRRNGSITLQTYHGTPLKFMGLDIRRKRPKELNWIKFANRSRQWEYAISSNEYSTRVWNRSNPYSYKFLEFGYPRNDIFFNSSHDVKDAIKKRLNIPSNKKVVLYAPTFRDYHKGKRQNETNKLFDAAAVAKALGDEYILLMKNHYFKKSFDVNQQHNIIDCSNYDNTNEILLITDILITDYSSIMFDFACLKRPIIIYAPDINEYKEKRGTYFELELFSPGLFTKNFNDLCNALDDKSFLHEIYQERINNFNKRFCKFDNGNATKKTVEFIMSLK